MRVNPAKITGVQSHLILVGRSRLQVEVGGCRFVCSQCWFAVPDRRNQSRSKNSMIAGRAHFDCRSLQLQVEAISIAGRYKYWCGLMPNSCFPAATPPSRKGLIDRPNMYGKPYRIAKAAGNNSGDVTAEFSGIPAYSPSTLIALDCSGYYYSNQIIEA
ncbi:hypothetical protein ALP74_200128 [Pseudomonas coronafaciens pv. garcae]|uniref:Uncharacterized protein n=1 Tax=Pseudomonas coronafaciens pv. garcae TaxID=251653 RepID=A0AB37QIX4_9PSED|nr:hypothetical protein ALP74_200128 [Pseudomonas coronafaciens pv. garcae]